MRLTTLASWFRADERATSPRGWALNLGLFRIVFIGAVVLPWALRNLGWVLEILPGLPRRVWAPISYYQLIPYEILGNPGLAKALALLNLVLVFLGLIGLFTRTSLTLAFVLSTYLFGLPENQGKIDNFHHVIWFLALLAAGPSGQLLSVDSLRRTKAPEGQAPIQSFAALFTLRYVWLLLGLLYLTPGVAKLLKTFTGGWASADNLRHVLWLKWFELTLFVPGAEPPLRADLLPSWMLAAFGVSVIAFEIGFLLIVLFRRPRPWLALIGIGFHLGNGLLLHIWFTTLIPVYVCLIDWSSLGRRMGILTAKQGPPDSPREPSPAPAASLLHPLGIGLLVCQLLVSSVMFLANETPGLVSRLPPPASRAISRLAGWRLEWPFASYPTFAYPTPGLFELWEARWALPGGEARVSLAAYNKAFGNSGLLWNLVKSAAAETDPGSFHELSIGLARRLWQAETAELRAATTEARVYRVRYRLGPPDPPASILSEALVETVPLRMLATSQGGEAAPRTRADLRLDFADLHQTIDGFGASDAFHGLFDDAQADLFFSPSKGIGLSLLRVVIESEGQYGRDAWGNAAKAAARGARVWGSPWSPNEAWKTTGKESSGGLRPAAREEWATLLAAFGLQLKARTGVDLYAVSVQNEPDHDTKGAYDMCLYSASEMRDFIKVLGPKLAVLNPRPKLMAPEPSGWHNLWREIDYMSAILADPAALGYLDIIGTHQYDNEVVNHPLPKGKPLWQTEMASFDGPSTDIENGVRVAKWIHAAIVTGSASAWHYWWLFSNNKNNEGLINKDGSLPKRLYTLGNYSKFIRPGFVRIGATGGAPDVLISAYKGLAPNAFVVVAINESGAEVELSVSLEGATASRVVPWLTTASQNLGPQAPIEIAQGRFTATLPPTSVVTLVGAR